MPEVPGGQFDFRMCEVCGVVLNPATLRDPDTYERIGEPWYEHPDWYEIHWPEEHEPVPVHGTPLVAYTPCDICHRDDPRWGFLPRKDILAVLPGGVVLDHGGIWYVCDVCKQAASRRSLSRMLQCWWDSPITNAEMTVEEKKAHRRTVVKDLYKAFINSHPAGPYELRLRNHNPQGKPRSRRGM
ncbi:hypothetical protein ACGFXC_24370 [Streptomyces sp. NPDC048507]|uniref:hypothetical protein n=1 Tax=Streptomyces sp. NPDC048507 TaxID=3365560 RepID=UPI00371578D2